MKKALFSIVFIVTSIISCKGQTLADTITYDAGWRFQQHGKYMNLNRLGKVVISNPEAYNWIKKAQSNKGLAGILGFTGGFLIGYPLGTALAGGEPNWALAAAGVGVIAIAIPIELKAKRQTHQAIDIYNAELQNSTSNIRPQLNLSINQYGLGFSLKF